jgi:hypothetical protein
MLKIEDLNSANLQTLINKITTLSANGATNYEDAFIKATEWFNTKPGSGTGLKFENLTYFLTDGDPTVHNGDSSSCACVEMSLAGLSFEVAPSEARLIRALERNGLVQYNKGNHQATLSPLGEAYAKNQQQEESQA